MKIKGLVIGLAALLAAGVPTSGVYAAPASFGSSYVQAEHEIGNCTTPATAVSFDNTPATINFCVSEEDRINQAEDVNDILVLTLPENVEYNVEVDGVEMVVYSDGTDIMIDGMTLVEYVTTRVSTEETNVNILINYDVTKVFEKFKRIFNPAMAEMDYTVTIGTVELSDLYYAAGSFSAEANAPGFTGEVVFTYMDGVMLFEGDLTEEFADMGQGATVELEGGHLEMHPVDAVPPTATTVGNIEYYECDACGLLFNDKDGLDETNEEDVKVYPFVEEQVGTVAKFDGVWYYVGDDRLANLEYTEFAENKNGTWLVKSGIVDFSVTSVVNGTIDGKNSWYYVRNNKYISDYTGFAKNKNGTWLVIKGEVDFGTTGVVKGTIDGKNSWYYVRNNKYISDYTGFAKNKNGTWYVKNGEVDFSVSSIVKGTINGNNTWYYVKNNKYDSSFTGIAKNQNGTWYVKNGAVAFNYSGNVSYNGKTYKVVNGKVQ